MRSRIPALPMLAVLALAASAAAQVTQVTRTIGGLGGLTSCGNYNPPTLCDGTTPASASVEFTYDAATTTLTLVVENTSPVTAGIANPVMTNLFFNAPPGAVQTVALSSQAGSGGAAPTWELTWDPNLLTNPNPNTANGFGRFNVMLAGGTGNGIANANADTLSVPPGSAVMGPVTFVFDVTPSPGATLNAGTFANALSITSNANKNVSLAAHFQSGGPYGQSGFVTNAPSCSPSSFLVGEPRIGSSVRLVMTAAPGCAGCLAVSPSPGPTLFFLPPPNTTLVIPIGDPMEVLIGAALAPASTIVDRWVTIPNEPAFVGLTVYGAVVVLNMQTGLFSVSHQFQFDILPA